MNVLICGHAGNVFWHSEHWLSKSASYDDPESRIRLKGWNYGERTCKGMMGICWEVVGILNILVGSYDK